MEYRKIQFKHLSWFVSLLNDLQIEPANVIVVAPLLVGYYDYVAILYVDKNANVANEVC
jgi:hypothetical protein